VALTTAFIQKCQIQDYQNKDKLSFVGYLQPEPKLGRTKPPCGPHAALGPRVGHSFSNRRQISIIFRPFNEIQYKIKIPFVSFSGIIWTRSKLQ